MKADNDFGDWHPIVRCDGSRVLRITRKGFGRNAMADLSFQQAIGDVATCNSLLKRGIGVPSVERRLDLKTSLRTLNRD